MKRLRYVYVWTENGLARKLRFAPPKVHTYVESDMRRPFIAGDAIYYNSKNNENRWFGGVVIDDSENDGFRLVEYKVYTDTTKTKTETRIGRFHIRDLRPRDIKVDNTW